MNKWRLLLFAVFCIFQPIYTENLFNGRERCLERRDFYRQNSRLLDHSKARPEVRVDRNRREFPERINDDGLRYSERINRDENVRSEDRRLRSTDRIRVSPFRQQITEHVNDRLDQRLRNTKQELRNIREEREERRSNTERKVSNVRLTRRLSQEDRRNEREDRTRNTLFRYSRVVDALNRRSVERRFDDIQDPLIRSRQGTDLNVRRELRSRSRTREDVRDDSEISDRFVRRVDSSRRNNERSQREFQSVPDNRRQNLRSESVIRETNNEIRRQRTAGTSRRDLEQRSAVQRREADEFHAFRSESRDNSDVASERILRFDDSRRQINERLTRAQRIVPDEIRRNNARLELSRDYNEENNRRSPATVNRVFERRESAQRTDESRQTRRELRGYSDRAYEREIVQRRESDAPRDSRRESRDSADKTNARYTTSDDSIRQTNERRYGQAQRNIRSEFIRTRDNAEVNRRSSPFTRDDTEGRNEANENRYLRREARNSDKADSRFNFHTSRNSRQDARENSRMDVTRNNEEVSRRISPVSKRNVDDRVDYLQRRDTFREFRRETRAQRSDDGYIVCASNRRTNNVRNISGRRESADTSDDTRQSRIETRRISDIRFENLGQRINEQLQSQNRRERQRSQSPISDIEKRSFAAIARDEVVTRARDNLDARRNSRREVRDFIPIARDVVDKRERDNLDARRNFRREVRDFVPIARDVVEKRERDNLDARRNSQRDVRNFVPIARDVVEKRERDNLEARRNFRREVRDFIPIARDVIEKRERDNLEARRDFRRAARDFVPIARDVVEKRERDNLEARRDFRREVRDFLPIARDVVEKRERDNLEARHDFRREVRDFVPIARDELEKRERDNLEARRDFRRAARDFVPIARDVVEKRERDNLDARRDFRREVRDFLPIARDVVEKRERDNLEARRDFRRAARDFVPIALDVVEKRERDNLDARRNFRPEVRDIRLEDSSRRDSEIFARVRREVLSKRIRDTDIRSLNELRQDNRRVDEDRRIARAIRDNRMEARKEIEPARYSIRDNERTKERTIPMPIRRIQPDDTSRRARINSNERDTLDQRIRSSQNNRISKVERIMEDDRNVERRVNRASQDYRFESRFIKNTFERNTERDSSKRLVDGNRQERDSRVDLSRDDRNSGKDTRNLKEEIRSMPTHNVDEEESKSFKWHHLLYLLQAVYIIGLLAKPAKENFGKKTGFGIWSHSPKLVKVD